MQIDEKELMLQLKEDIIKSQKYVRIEVVVGKCEEYSMPYATLETRQVSTNEVASAIASVRAMCDQLVKESPQLEECLKHITTKTSNSIAYNPEENKGE